MPIYTYECARCGKTAERVNVPVAERDNQTCALRGGPKCFDAEARAAREARLAGKDPDAPPGASPLPLSKQIEAVEDQYGLDGLAEMEEPVKLERRTDLDVHARTSYSWSGGGALGY